jgi:hypothetical protein
MLLSKYSPDLNLRHHSSPRRHRHDLQTRALQSDSTREGTGTEVTLVAVVASDCSETGKLLATLGCARAIRAAVRAMSIGVADLKPARLLAVRALAVISPTSILYSFSMTRPTSKDRHDLIANDTAVGQRQRDR